MSTKKYQLMKNISPEGEVYVTVESVGAENVLGVPWREVKKQWRQFYLDQAANLRNLSEKDLFS